MTFTWRIFGMKAPSLYSFGSEKSLISSEKSLTMSPKKKKDEVGSTPGFTLRPMASKVKPRNSLLKYVNNTPMKIIEEKVIEEKWGEKELQFEQDRRRISAFEDRQL